MHSLEQIFALLPWCPSVCPSRVGMNCYHMVHVSADLSLWLDSPMFWATWHQSISVYSQQYFSNFTWKRGGVLMCKLFVISQERLKIEVKLLFSANTKSYMLRSFSLQRITLTWPWMALHAIFAVPKLLVCRRLESSFPIVIWSQSCCVYAESVLVMASDADQCPGRLLQQAAIYNNVELMESLLEGSEYLQHINAPDSFGRTALYTSVTNNSYECCQLLLLAGGEWVCRV